MGITTPDVPVGRDFFLRKLFSLPLLLPWLRRPIPKQTLKMSWYLVVENKGGRVRQKAT